MFRFLSDAAVVDSRRAHRGRLGFAGLALVLRAGLALGGPFFLGRAVDIVQYGEGESALFQAIILILAFALGTGFAQFWMRLLWIGWSRFAERDMRDGLFARLLGLSPPFFTRSRVGDLMSRLTSDVEAVRMGYGPGVMHCAQTGLILLGGFSLMVWQSWFLTLWAFVPLILLFLLLKHLLPRIHAGSTAVQEAQAALSTRAQEAFSGARVVQAFAREENEISRFERLSGNYRDRNMRLARDRGLFGTLIEMFNGLVIVAVLVVGGMEVVNGQLTVGDFVAFNGYLRLMIWPMIALSWTLSLFQRAEAASERLDALREERPEILGGPRAEHPRPPLVAEGLGHTFPGASRPVLEGIDFRLPAGGTLGLVGPTGSGKSTLVDLILRLEDPQPGMLRFGGHDVREFRLDRLREAVALVPQESFLFGDTLRANILFGVDAAGEEEVEEAVYRSCLDQDLPAFTDGLDTVVGERGVSLSGGQKQRVALARAILKQAPFLILDDALSAVDVETEQRILERLRPVISGRTTVIVSHRLSAVAAADEILVLDDGRVIERGDHATLLAKDGAYARLHRLQQDERELKEMG